MEASSTPGSPPPDYREVLYWRLNNRPGLMLALQVLSLPLFAASAVSFFWIALRFGKLPNHFPTENATYLLALIADAFITLMLHELVHGAAMRVFGARPQYGILWKQFIIYATSPGYAFTRAQYLVTSLAPLAGLSLLSVAAIWVLAGSPWVLLFILMAAVNLGGSVGDVWITAVVLRFPPSARVIDERDGVRILLPGDSTDLR